MKDVVLEHVRETFREPIKNCQTCAHNTPSTSGLGESFDHCRRFQAYCSCAFHQCWDNRQHELTEWQAKPPSPPRKPRRSLRRWLWDLLFA